MLNPEADLWGRRGGEKVTMITVIAADSWVRVQACLGTGMSLTVSVPVAFFESEIQALWKWVVFFI